MKITSWNVNGIRAVVKKGNFEEIFKTKPDILCLQETKAEVGDLSEETKSIKGYTSYFASSKKKKGHSGVGVYTKIKPEKVEAGMGTPEFDDEGRMLVLYFKDFVLINCYFPNGGMGPERLQYKLDFYDAFLEFVEGLRKKYKKVIFCGDINTAHEEIDLARPRENEENTGFLPEERAWLDELVAHGWVDAFRHFYPTKKDIYTYWDLKTGARDRNVGWRIDYFFVTPPVLPGLVKCETLKEQFGSDHCPVAITLK